MGRYHKVGGELKNDQPVWKKEEGGSSRYIYFNSNGHWVIDNDLSENSILLWGPSNDAFLPLKAVPRFGWRAPIGTDRNQNDSSYWAVDETLVISAGDDSNSFSKDLMKGSHAAVQ